MSHSAVVLASLMSVLGLAACNEPTDPPAPKTSELASIAPSPTTETRPASVPAN